MNSIANRTKRRRLTNSLVFCNCGPVSPWFLRVEGNYAINISGASQCRFKMRFFQRVLRKLIEIWAVCNRNAATGNGHPVQPESN